MDDVTVTFIVFGLQFGRTATYTLLTIAFLAFEIELHLQIISAVHYVWGGFGRRHFRGGG